nr:FKBP-type peptidyl-prolyl cis-trans isomerase [Microlunatus panaciterrae]
MGACSDKTDKASTPSTPAASASASASPSPSAAKVTPSSNFDKVTVKGDFGKQPKVTVKKPWAIDKTRTKVLKDSNGAKIRKGTSVEVNYVGLNGRTGVAFDESYSAGKPVAFSLDQVVPGFGKGLVGQRQGSRVLIAMPGKDGYDSQGGNPQINVQVGDTLIFVVDIVAVTLDGPEGKKVEPKKGLPTVTDEKGTPKVSIPKGDPPASLQIQPLIKGTGKKVAASDQITFRYQWLTWSDGKVVEQNYGAAPATYPLNGLLPGMQKGLVNQTVGSRVLLVVPPADGYPDGNEKPKIGKGETLVLVVDLLFAQQGQ